jgi:putative ABC transport system permease protein
MTRPRTQKIFSDLWGNRSRSLLVLASMVVGLFAIGVVTTIYVIGPQDMQVSYAATNPANLAVMTTPFDRCLVEHIQGLPGMRQVEGVRTFGTRLETQPGEWTAIEMKAIKDPARMQINQLRLVDGVWPPGDRQIVIDQYKLDDTHARLGDLITLELPSGKTRQLELVGVVQDLSIGAYRGAGGFFNAPVQGYVTMDTLDWLEQPAPKLNNMLLVTLNGDTNSHAYLESSAQIVREEVKKCNVEIVSMMLRSSTEHPNLYLSRAILAVLLVIGLLVSFLSGFLIANTLQAIMNQQVQQIGILKTVGARRGQIAAIYLLLSLLFGVLAYIVALPLSMLVGFRLVDFLTVQMNYIFYGPRLVLPVAVLMAVIAVLMPQIAAFLPVRQGTRISVQEALSGYSQSHPPERSWLDRQISRLRNSSMLLVVALRNTFRRKGRLLLTLITLTLGGAVFIATFNVRVSLVDYVDHIIQYFLADVNITLDRPYRIDEIAPKIKEVPGISMVEGWMYARTELVLEDGTIGESVSLLAPPAGSPLVKPILVDGRWILPGDRNAIALSELFKDQFPDLNVGDTLRLRVNGDETDWTVVGFFQLGGKVSGYSAYTSYEYLADLLHQTGRAVGYRVVADRLDLTREQQDALGKAIEVHLKESGINVVDVSTGQALTQTASDGFTVLTAFLLFLALLTALVGSIGLAGTMTLNVMERTREIGILRAIGATDRTLMRMVLVEGGLIGLMSWILSSVIAFPISVIMADSISLSLFGSPANFGFTPVGFILWLGVVVILSVLASVIPARGATHLTIREVLAYE